MLLVSHVPHTIRYCGMMGIGHESVGNHVRPGKVDKDQSACMKVKYETRHLT